MEQSFEDLGAEFWRLKERQCKGIRERGWGGRGGRRGAVGTGARLCSFVNQGREFEIYSNFIGKSVNGLKLLRAHVIMLGPPRIISLF